MRTDDRIMVNMAKALARMIYETTHLSPEQDDGSHWCKISAEALNEARAALERARALLNDGGRNE